MKTRLVRVGNSQGVRIPKPLIEQAGLQGDLEIEVKNRSVVIRSVKKPAASAASTARRARSIPKGKSPEKAKKSWVDLLLACPEKGWFEPMSRSESTDTIRSPFE